MKKQPVQGNPFLSVNIAQYICSFSKPAFLGKKEGVEEERERKKILEVWCLQLQNCHAACWYRNCFCLFHSHAQSQIPEPLRHLEGQGGENSRDKSHRGFYSSDRIAHTVLKSVFSTAQSMGDILSARSHCWVLGYLGQLTSVAESSC